MPTWIAEHLVRLVDCSHLRLAATLVGMCRQNRFPADGLTEGVRTNSARQRARYSLGLLDLLRVRVPRNAKNLVVVLLARLLEQFLRALQALVDLQEVSRTR